MPRSRNAKREIINASCVNGWIHERHDHHLSCERENTNRHSLQGLKPFSVEFKDNRICWISVYVGSWTSCPQRLVWQDCLSMGLLRNKHLGMGLNMQVILLEKVPQQKMRREAGRNTRWPEPEWRTAGKKDGWKHSRMFQVSWGWLLEESCAVWEPCLLWHPHHVVIGWEQPGKQGLGQKCSWWDSERSSSGPWSATLRAGGLPGGFSWPWLVVLLMGFWKIFNINLRRTLLSNGWLIGTKVINPSMPHFPYCKWKLWISTSDCYYWSTVPTHMSAQ